ncbi:MAG: hypothetical protein KAY05_10015, partial [Aeromonadaceae bacterium]|nr:hypothetical protein [Aeromonadaceae bacterium]
MQKQICSKLSYSFYTNKMPTFLMWCPLALDRIKEAELVILVSYEVQERQPLSPTRRKPFPGGSMAASLPPTVGSTGYLS